MELHGARRVVAFMAAHPEGFDTIDEAAEVIAAYNPQRRRPEDLDGLHKVLRQRGDRRWVWRWDPAFVTRIFNSSKEIETLAPKCSRLWEIFSLLVHDVYRHRRYSSAVYYPTWCLKRR